MNPAVTRSVDRFLTQSLAKIGHKTLTNSQSNQMKEQFLIELSSVKENFGTHKKPDMRSKPGNMESTMDKEEMRSSHQEGEKNLKCSK